jgi:putative PIN family toxin of toxin-antitoxin system
MDVMLDTNVIISAALFPNERMNRFLDVLSHDHQLFLCSYCLEELERVVRIKWKPRLKHIELFLQKLQYTLIHTPSVNILDTVIVIRDEKDYPVIVSAIIADVDVFITGDKDFGGLNLERPEILTITEFMNKYT